MQNISESIAPESKSHAEAVVRVDRRIAVKPVVVAALDSWEYNEFLRPHLKAAAKWPFEIERMEPNYINERLVETLNRHCSEVLMTCWNTRPLPGSLLREATTLKYVAHVGGAVRYFLPRELIEQGLLLSNWGETAAGTVAEHTLLQILACLRRAAKWQLEMHLHRQWKPENYEVFSLFGKRVGIYGYGVCARQLVRLLRPFDCKISTYSDSLPESMENGVRRAVSLEELFGTHEIVVVLEALTERTCRSVDERLLRLLPENSVFVNTARGRIVDEAALALIATERKIQVALDVFEKEPLPEHSPLRGLENVFLTPHIAGPTTDSRQLCGLYALKNINAYLNRQTVRSVVGLAEYDRMSST